MCSTAGAVQTVGDVQYCRGYHDSCGEASLSAVGDAQYSGGYH